MGIIELLIIVLLLLWVFGYFGRGRLPIGGGGWIHTLLVIVVILVILRLLGIV
ncbi:MAG: lmo0937 family membrane protein [Chloroflexi bacterium]|nr:MAG: lmo0937 family membrane protein [Candidatus Rokubacteria bacterium]TME76946.1 MAG: lmo0937 family membrane protein [Chloroflexota bacterium]TMF58108.1 MAG: lmo0937 family membrane protein [Chloroflexota bacterium]TMG41481.1 MAG: lmo0937 family membrane protein [Chloroflexota bacterium]